MPLLRFLQLIVLLVALGSLGGARAEQDLQSLSPEQLVALVNGAIVEEKSSIFDGRFSGAVDASGFTIVADRVAEHGTTEQKAQVFGIAGMRVDSIADAGRFLAPVSGTKQAAADITRGLTKILSSDTNGVIDELSYNKRFDNGKAFTNYIEQLIESGQADTVSSIQVQLILGNAGQGNHVERYNQVVDGLATNAGKMGYFSGTLKNALDNINYSDNEKQTVEQSIVRTTANILSGSAGLAYPVAEFAIGSGGEVAANDVANVLSRSTAGYGDMIIGSTMPFDPVTNNELGSSKAFVGYQGLRQQVVRANQHNAD